MSERKGRSSPNRSPRKRNADGATRLSVPIRGSSPPPLDELPEDDFEDLCRDLFEREANIATCSRFGTRGQTQLGIDLLADCKNSADQHVAQCKCYKDFPRDRITEASNEFMRHLSHWKDRRVVRFVLIVSEPLEKTGQREQILVERCRFQAEGIRYEIWSLDTLITRLRPWPELVERYIDQGRGGFWVERICGPAPYRLGARSGGKRGATTPRPSIEPQFDELMALAAKGLTAKLDECRSNARSGLIASAEATLAGMLSDPAIVRVVSRAVHARGLRLQASLALDRPNGESRAKTLLAEADRLDGTSSTRLHAQIILNEQGPEACLEHLQANGNGSEEDLCLRAVCHLRTGAAHEAIILLDPLIASAASADPERLLALALSSTGRAEEACTHARSAHAREPQGWATRIALGVVLYSASLSRITAHGSIAGWPEPCDWHVVLRDDDSVERLREAGDVFQSLIADKQERIDRQTLQAWSLACLANDSERQVEAESFCREVIRECPTNAAAIAWALARAFPMDGKQQVFDPAAVERALEDLLSSGRGDLLQLIVLASLMSFRGKSSKVVAMLRRHQRHFSEGRTAGQFAIVLAEANLRSGGAVTSPDMIDRNRLEMLRLEDEADLTVRRDRLVEIARRLKETGGNDQAFAEALFRLGTLGFVGEAAPFADLLVELVGTADAVRLGAHAKASVDDYAGTVELLDARVAAFQGGVLPRSLRVLRAQCNEHLGRLPDAIAEMQALRGSGEAIFEVMSLADMYVRRGDLALAADAISGIVDAPEITPELALRFAHVLGNDAPKVATKLWRRAVAQEIEPGLLTTAVTIAHRLALGPESGGIMARMTAQAVPMGAGAQQADVVSMSMDQVLEFLRARADEMERFSRLHEVGTVPMHLLGPRMGWSFPRLFHEATTRRERTASTGGMLLAAHGGRSIAGSLPDDPGAWRLHVDVTGILMAHHLGILDTVERCFRPLRVSSHLVPSLLAMRGELLDGNPGEIESIRDILAAVDAGLVLLVKPNGSGTTISDSSGALLDLAATMDGIALLWDEDARAAFAVGSAAVNLSGLVESLELVGEIDDPEASAARMQLGTEGGATPVSVMSERGAVLICHANTIQELARAKLLASTCRAFSVHAEEGYITHLRGSLSEGEARRDTAAWVNDLRARLNRGIQGGTYELLPVLRVPELELGHRDGPTACLLDLVRLPAAEGNVVWIDDRALNAHAACGDVPLLGIADILAALRHFGRLTNEEYHARLLRLRAGHVAFIQAGDGELEFWLRRAPVVDGRLVETDELSVLRRYVARCIARETILQIPPVPEGAPNPGGEVGFVISWQRAVATTLTALWADPALRGDHVLACSRWLRDSIAIDRYERLPVFQATAEGRLAVLVSGLSTLLCTGFLLLPPLCQVEGRCINYMAWLETEVVGPRLRADPDIRQSLVAALTAFLAGRPATEQDEAARMRRTLTARFLGKLPDVLRSEIMRHRAILADLGFDQDLRVTQFGDLTFSAKAYLDAVTNAIASGADAVLVDESGVAATISASIAQGQVVANVVADQMQVSIADPVNNLLAADEDAREFLSRSTVWLDAPVEQRRHHLDLLLAMPDKAERVMAAIDLRAGTAACFYDALRARLGRGVGISFNDLEPPSLRSVLDHLRLPASGTFQERLDTAAVELVGDHGIHGALQRLAHLPVALPKSLTDAFMALAPAARSAIVEGLSAAGPTPLQRVHIARLAAMSEGSSGDGHLLRKQLWGLATMHGNGESDVLVAILKAVSARSADWTGASGLASAERIIACWCHAGVLFKIIHPVVEQTELKALAERYSGDSMSAVFANEMEFRADVASPRSISAEVLLIWGLAHSCDIAMLGMIPDDLRKLLAELVVQDIDGTPFPHGSLLDAKWLRPNVTKSFLSGPIEELVRAVTGTDVGRSYGFEAQHEILVQCLGSAGGDALGLQAWRMVLCVMTLAAVPPELEEMLVAAIHRSSTIDAGFDPPLWHALLRFACLQAAYSPSSRLNAAATGLFEALAPQFIDRATGEEAAKLCAWALLREALDLSRGPTGDVGIDGFVNISRRLVVGRPRTAAAIREFVNQAARQLRFELAEDLWPLLLELRSR